MISAVLHASLMPFFLQVSYYVDGESGFVPTITYTDGYTPEFDNQTYQTAVLDEVFFDIIKECLGK